MIAGGRRVATLRAAVGRYAAHLVRAVIEGARGYSRHYGSQLAAAISYHVLFSLFPLAITVVSVAGLVLQDDQRRADFTNWVLDHVPLAHNAGVDLAAAIDGLSGPLSAAGLIALAGFAWAASGMMSAVRRGLDAAFAEGVGRPAVQGKLVDFLLVLLTGAVILVAIGLSILNRIVQGLGSLVVGPDAVAETLRVVEPLLLMFGAFVLLYRYVPVTKPNARDIWPAALLASAGFEAVNVGFSFYLQNFSNYNVVYGSLGAALTFLVVVYAGAAVFLLGAEVAAAWPGARDAPPPGPDDDLSKGDQIARALRGLVVRDDDPAPPES